MDRTDINLTEAITHTQGEISRTDTKAGLLLTLDGLLVAALGLLGTSINGPCLALALAGAAAVVASVVLSVIVVRPQLRLSGRPDRSSWVQWAQASQDDIRSGLAEDRRLERLAALSALVLRKMRVLQLACDASVLAVALVAAAILAR